MPSATGLFHAARVRPRMDSVRKGLRAGDIEKDTYERLVCTHCGERLETESDPDQIAKLRQCPDCGREWEQYS